MFVRLLLMPRMLVFMGAMVSRSMLVAMPLLPFPMAMLVCMFMAVRVHVLMLMLVLVRLSLVFVFMFVLVPMLVLMLMLVRVFAFHLHAPFCKLPARSADKERGHDVFCIPHDLPGGYLRQPVFRRRTTAS
jgi:hypothetical protein